jgi:gamma-glutamylcyclotransferase (GGCT)/AIG2-like uncharacterized protein YtfP
MVHHLFVYGTLRDPSIRKKITGRDIQVLKSGILGGYRLSNIEFEEGGYPIIWEDVNSTEEITGEVIEITDRELKLMDEYEGTDYRRIKEILKDNSVVWVYTK